MEKNERTIEVLNDLIHINNDRVEGYEKAIDQTNEDDSDLRNIFHRMAEESKIYVRELSSQVQKLGGKPATGTTAAGKVYRVWMDVKSSLSGSTRKSVLEECEYGEDAAQRAYEKALAPGHEIPSEVRSLIHKEQRGLISSHDLIKSYRDSQAAKHS